MAIVWIDSMSELSNRVYPLGGWTLTGVSGVSGRDGQTGGAIQSTTSTRALVLLPAPAAQILVGFAVKVTGTSTVIRMPSIVADGSTLSHLTVSFDAAGHLTLLRGTHTGTLIATSNQIWTDLSGWHFIEMKATVADAGCICIVKVDGVEWINFTGDTRNAGTSTSPDTVFWQGATNAAIQIDDLYVFDATGPAPYNDFFGDCQVRRLFPNGEGAQLAWTPSTGTTHNTLVRSEEHTSELQSLRH